MTNISVIHSVQLLFWASNTNTDVLCTNLYGFGMQLDLEVRFQVRMGYTVFFMDIRTFFLLSVCFPLHLSPLKNPVESTSLVRNAFFIVLKAWG